MSRLYFSLLLVACLYHCNIQAQRIQLTDTIFGDRVKAFEQAVDKQDLKKAYKLIAIGNEHLEKIIPTNTEALLYDVYTKFTTDFLQENYQSTHLKWLGYDFLKNTTIPPQKMKALFVQDSITYAVLPDSLSFLADSLLQYVHCGTEKYAHFDSSYVYYALRRDIQRTTSQLKEAVTNKKNCSLRTISFYKLLKNAVKPFGKREPIFISDNWRFRAFYYIDPSHPKRPFYQQRLQRYDFMDKVLGYKDGYIGYGNMLYKYFPPKIYQVFFAKDNKLVLVYAKYYTSYYWVIYPADKMNDKAYAPPLIFDTEMSH